ncbi:hypothetical protein B0O80DRAFT_382166 [Mortierella sp. GBAus27b]|nr:hypothetical protein B0O80DRAFT_382166 [Mortierella sp. GBAus27b]
MAALLQNFLTTPSPIFEGPNVRLVQACAVERLAQTLKHFPTGDDVAMSTVHALLNTLYSHNSTTTNENPESQGQSILIQENVVVAISKIACAFDGDKITPIALSMLAQQIRHHSHKLDCVIVSSLTDMALSGSESSFNDITQILANLSKLSISPENKPETKELCEAVNACQLRLAKAISARPEFYPAYLTCLLKLFVEKGVQIQLTVQANKKSQNKINSLSAELGLLLPVLGQLLSHEDFKPHLHPSKEDVKLFRDAWFHCVLFEFVKDSPWYKEWSDSMLLIARKTPAFVSGDFGTNAYIEGDVEYNSVLPRSILEDQKSSMRATLASYLPGQTSEIKSLSSAKVVFLLSVYHVETMRSRQGNCSFILKYFMNSGVNDGGLSTCLEAIADQAVNVFVSESQTKVLSHTLDDNVRQQVRNLIIGCAHRLKRVSSLSSKWILRMIAAFPQLMCDKSLLTLVLEVSELLWLSCENEMTDEYCPNYTFKSSKVDVTIDLPDSYPYRRELLTKFVELTRKWIEASMANSPQEVDALLQDYLAESEKIHTGISRVHMGRTLAARAGKDLIKSSFETLPNIPGASIDNSSVFFQEFSARRRYQGEIGGIETFSTIVTTQSGSVLKSQLPALRENLQSMAQQVKEGKFVENKDLANALHRAVSALVTLDKIEEDLVKMIAWIPIYLFTPDSMKIGTSVWNWLITEKPAVERRLMSEVASGWAWASRNKKGLFSPLLDTMDPFRARMEYSPSDKKARQESYKIASYLFIPHIIWIEFLSSRFQATRYGNRDMVDVFTRLIQLTFDAGYKMSTHPVAREGRFQLILLGLRLIQSNRMEALVEYKIRSALYLAALSWFELSPSWSFGGNKMLSKTETRTMKEFGVALDQDKIFLDRILSSIQSSEAQDGVGPNYVIANNLTRDAIVRKHTQCRRLLSLLNENELNRLSVWSKPLIFGSAAGPEANAIEKTLSEEGWRNTVRFAWSVSPTLALQLTSRFKNNVIASELSQLLTTDPFAAVHDSHAVEILLGEGNVRYSPSQLKYLLFWGPVPSITAISYFQPAYQNDPMILQYAMRSLEHSPTEVVFFYIPQVVQALRHDDLGYVEKYIMRAARVSQLFAHQIIWNMKANMYKDNNSEVEDPLKPVLDRIIENIVNGLSGEDKIFYEREFKFFKQVTDISGTLMPLVKKTKPEKKKKIDEEMAKIVVDVGVYLPSNPDGVVVDIDKNSGRPLQSHAKTPFMATFKVRKTRTTQGIEKSIIKSGTDADEEKDAAPKVEDVWQSAIFKVGDDCRQDVLAIQLIAVFKNIFTSVGLDLYLFPYRIVATAPGCGMIDVIPNSISRDMLGREKVNNLQDYFVTKYGGVDSIDYQKARNNFIQSVAAYSVISYLLQFKDRHNGNIMIDDDGHVVHIDFGFILDISPGGNINFESSPFKLTAEMIQIMGTSVEDQGYRWFCELCIKAYLATRPYAEQICQMVALMLESGLPCFRGETIKRLRSRFQLDRSERQAADFMKERVDESYLNRRTVLYDSFQKVTNGIPH